MRIIRDPEFVRGWPVLMAGFLGLVFNMATVHLNTLAVLTPALTKEFGWSRSEVQGSFVVLTCVFLLAAPIAGGLVGRYGSRPVLLVSIPLFSLSFMSFALIQGSLFQFYALAAVNALVGSGTLPMAYARVVTAWFPRRTGFALGIVMVGTSVLTVVAVPALTAILNSFGWRAVYVFVGAASLVIYPIVWALLKPAPSAGDGNLDTHKVELEGGASLREALSQRRLWVMGLSFMLASAAISGCLINLPTLLIDMGLGNSEMMMVAPVLGASAIFGRLTGGWLLDRWWAPAIGLVFMFLLAVGLAILGVGDLGWKLAALALFLIGFSAGVEHDMLPYMVSRYFGMRSYAAVYGVLYTITGFGGGMAPIIFSIAYDISGSFQTVLFSAGAAIVVVGVILLSLGQYEYFRMGSRLSSKKPS